MKVKEVAELVGISVRTLHYYDEIGLLKPNNITESGYRLYSERNLEQLQQILFFRELGFPLKEIKTMIDSPAFDQLEALQMHKNVLIKKREHMDILIKTIDKTIAFSKGEIEMTREERFVGFNFDQNEYAQEARERWGNEAVDTFKEKIERLSKEEKRNMEEEFGVIFTRLAKIRHSPAESSEAQEAIEDWWKYLNQIGNYSLQSFKNLGELYVIDERFTKNIDTYGEGLAQFMCDAMRVFAERNK